MTRTIGIFVFDDVELLDLAGPYEVFTCASRVHTRLNPGAARDYQIMSIPTMAVFQGGKIVKQIVGAKPKAAILRDLESYL